MTEGNRYRIESVVQSSKIVDMIADNKEPMGASEVAKAMGITLNTAFRMCVTLEEIGDLMQIGDKFSLGSRHAILWARKKAMLEGERTRIKKQIAELE